MCCDPRPAGPYRRRAEGELKERAKTTQMEQKGRLLTRCFLSLGEKIPRAGDRMFLQNNHHCQGKLELISVFQGHVTLRSSFSSALLLKRLNDPFFWMNYEPWEQICHFLRFFQDQSCLSPLVPLVFTSPPSVLPFCCLHLIKKHRWRTSLRVPTANCEEPEFDLSVCLQEHQKESLHLFLSAV